MRRYRRPEPIHYTAWRVFAWLITRRETYDFIMCSLIFLAGVWLGYAIWGM